MEERNIRWGELIGGLLLVCSSVALVVSLWNQLQQIPYFQSFIFVAVSAAVFGVGLYAHHRWKLEATSRGLLLIGTLLVPLNFVAMAILSRGVEATGRGRSVRHGREAGHVAHRGGLAGRLRVAVGPGRPHPHPQGLAAGRGGRGGQFGRHRGNRHVDSRRVACRGGLGAGAVPVALFWVAVGGRLFALAGPHAATRRHRLELPQITGLCILLGVTAFATFVALGLLAAQAIDLRHLAAMLTQFSVLTVLAALPVLAAGLTVMRGAARQDAWRPTTWRERSWRWSADC